MRLILLLFLVLCGLPEQVYSAEALRNASVLDLKTGTRVVLPDKSIATITERNASGHWLASGGIEISDQGEILSGKFVGKHVEISRDVSVAELLTDMPIIKEPEVKPAPPPATRKTPPSSSAPKAKPAQKPAPSSGETSRVAPGQPLRIPESAIPTGNLSFLEGCWQGTRPEYYSKRTIKECFCFDSQGKAGKRRIYDITYSNRQCISAARAKLSSNGVLRVTSDAAVCNDGEEWGSAEMQCQNSGPQTPCSWIFPMAGHGHQAYVIPFVRVESCGR